MLTQYCASCGAANHYSGEKPKACKKCGESFAAQLDGFKGIVVGKANRQWEESLDGPDESYAFEKRGYNENESGEDFYPTKGFNISTFGVSVESDEKVNLGKKDGENNFSQTSASIRKPKKLSHLGKNPVVSERDSSAPSAKNEERPVIMSKAEMLAKVLAQAKIAPSPVVRSKNVRKSNKSTSCKTQSRRSKTK